MTLTGWMLFIAMAVIVETLVRAVTTLSYFKNNSDHISNLKFYIALGFAEAISFSFVYLTKGGMILTYFGIITFPYLDAILSGLMISTGSNMVHDIYSTIINFKEKIQAQKEIAQKTAKALK